MIISRLYSPPKVIICYLISFFYILDDINLIYVTTNPHPKHTKKIVTISPIKESNNKSKKQFLGHKTVSNGTKKYQCRKRESKKVKVDNDSIKPSYIIDLTNEEETSEKSEKSVKKIGKNKSEFCFSCNWKFPERMSIARRNIHVNDCLEGKGKLDIMKYSEEIKIKKITHLSPKKLKKLASCPICGKDIAANNSKGKYNHLTYCTKRIE